MAKSSKKIGKVIALMGAFAAGTIGNAFANPQRIISQDASSRNLEARVDGTVIDTFTLPSVRKGYEGVPFTYEVLIGNNGLYARRKDEPQTVFLLSAFYDIDNNGIYGKMENAMIKEGIPMNMTKTFTDKVLEAYTQYIKNQNQTASVPPTLLTPLPPANYNVPVPTSQTKETPDASLMTPETGYNEKQPLPAPEAPKSSSPNTLVNITNAPKAQDKKSALELSLDFTYAPGIFGGRIGLMGKLNNWFGIETGISGAYGFPEIVDSVKTPPSSTGRYFAGSIINENIVKLGADVGLCFGDKNGNIYLGIGPSIWVFGQKTSESLYDANNNVIKSNVNSELNLIPSLDAYFGYQAGWFRFSVGWNSRKGFYGQTGISIPLNKE